MSSRRCSARSDRRRARLRGCSTASLTASARARRRCTARCIHRPRQSRTSLRNSSDAGARSRRSRPGSRGSKRAKRGVLPRVLSVEEVTALIAEIGIETEVFAFGSVGPMSEGRCFLSSYLTGLSPTSEGACAPASHVIFLEKDGRVLSMLGQVTLNSFARGEPAAYPTPCKGRYVTHGRASYLFEEPVALNAISILPELKAAGVTALKIEGRQRSR